MKLLLLLACLAALASPPAAAQQSSAANQASAPPAVPVAVDSAAVLHQLFRRARRSGLALSGLTVINTTNEVHALRNDPRQGYKIVAAIGIGANAALVAFSVVNYIKYSRRRERETVEQLRLHQPLRPYVQRNYTVALAKAATPHR